MGLDQYLSANRHAEEEPEQAAVLLATLGLTSGDVTEHGNHAEEA